MALINCAVLFDKVQNLALENSFMLSLVDLFLPSLYLTIWENKISFYKGEQAKRAAEKLQ